MEEQITELLAFFKALADANRLKIIGLLAQDEYPVEQIAEMLDLRPSTVSHHLSKLSKAGLVSRARRATTISTAWRPKSWKRCPKGFCHARPCRLSGRMWIWTPTTAR